MVAASSTAERKNKALPQGRTTGLLSRKSQSFSSNLLAEEDRCVVYVMRLGWLAEIITPRRRHFHSALASFNWTTKTLQRLSDLCHRRTHVLCGLPELDQLCVGHSLETFSQLGDFDPLSKSN